MKREKEFMIYDLRFTIENLEGGPRFYFIVPRAGDPRLRDKSKIINRKS